MHVRRNSCNPLRNEIWRCTAWGGERGANGFGCQPASLAPSDLATRGRADWKRPHWPSHWPSHSMLRSRGAGDAINAVRCKGGPPVCRPPAGPPTYVTRWKREAVRLQSWTLSDIEWLSQCGSPPTARYKRRTTTDLIPRGQLHAVRWRGDRGIRQLELVVKGDGRAVIGCVRRGSSAAGLASPASLEETHAGGLTWLDKANERMSEQVMNE